jgi:hypothetical protein
MFHARRAIYEGPRDAAVLAVAEWNRQNSESVGTFVVKRRARPSHSNSCQYCPALIRQNSSFVGVPLMAHVMRIPSMPMRKCECARKGKDANQCNGAQFHDVSSTSRSRITFGCHGLELHERALRDPCQSSTIMGLTFSVRPISTTAAVGRAPFEKRRPRKPPWVCSDHRL